MSSRPWYRWFPGDYVQDTVHISPQADLLYRRLLDIHWRDGSIPRDQDEIRHLTRLPVEWFEMAWPEVAHFFRRRGDVLIQDRMASELRGVKRKIGQTKSAAKSRWNKGLHANAMRTQCDPDPDPDPHTSKTKTLPVSPSHENDISPEFETAWKAYPKRSGNNPKRRAAKAWKATIQRHSSNGASIQICADILAGTKRYATWCAATDKLRTEVVMMAATFFGPDEPWAQAWESPRVPAHESPAERVKRLARERGTWVDDAPQPTSKGRLFDEQGELL